MEDAKDRIPFWISWLMILLRRIVLQFMMFTGSDKWMLTIIRSSKLTTGVRVHRKVLGRLTHSDWLKEANDKSKGWNEGSR